jgi:hypothetical protein
MLETIVSEEDFLNTFENGVKNSSDYRLVQRLRSQKETCEQITKITGRPLATVKGWIAGRKPYCLHILDRAKESEIMPLTKNSPKLPALYEMCSWLFWTGFLTKDYEARICEKPETMEKLKEYFQKTLQLKGMYTGNALRFKGHHYGRVLNRMGIPAGYSKSTQEIHVPKAIMTDSNAQYRFLEILFKTRKTINKKHWTLYLIENAEALGKEIIELINTAMPELSITYENFHMEIHNNRRSPRIRFSKQNMTEIEKHYPRLTEPNGLLPENSYCNTHNTSTCQQANQ